MAHFSASALFALIILGCISTGAYSNSFSAVITDQQNRPLADAVVELIPHQPLAETVQTVASVAQRGLMFTPFVTAVPRGSLVDFPNQDKTRHHVYSFSAAKSFEIQLYSGKPEQPVLFDQAGVVALGCNIHDYMQAYIYVGESAYLAVTDDKGMAVFPDIPDGSYQLKLWHPWQNADWVTQNVQIKQGQVMSYQLAITAQEKPKKPKKGFGASYTP